VRARDLRLPALRIILAVSAALIPILPSSIAAQTTAPSPTPQYKGLPVEEVPIRGNVQVPTSVIRNVIRTRPGDKYDPAAVEDDYRRVYDLRKFSNVEALVEPTDHGTVNVVFVVTEQKLVKKTTYRGNKKVDTPTLESTTDLKVGQAIDPFRIALAKQAIVNVYRDKNFPEAHVDVPTDPLTERGEVIFNIVEGPQVRIRNINFIGAHAFSPGQLQDQIKTQTWFPIFRPGKYDSEQVEEDMGALRKYYQEHGFFDARVGRKLIYSPDNTELQIDFLIDEGQRYVVQRVTFEDNASLSNAQLRKALKLREGMFYDAETSQRDIRQIVNEYSPFGFIYAPTGQGDPDYLRIEPQTVFLPEPGRIELLYRIREGKPFRLRQIIVKGNDKSQQKLVLREFRDFAPGGVYNSGAVQDALERLRATPFFSTVTATPIGDDPSFRDLLVEVTEQKTAQFNIGAGINSNGGIGGNITFEQRNFDITNVPNDWRDALGEHAFTGAGQGFRASFEPGTIQTNASLRFSEPWLFDQPYNFIDDLYLRSVIREHYTDERIGDRVTFGKRFDYENSLALTLRGERVAIKSIDDERFRPPEILEQRGDHLLTSVGLTYHRDTTNPGFLPYKGTTTTVGWEGFGLLGGEYNFHRFVAGWNGYQTLHTDLLDRKTVFGLHLNSGFLVGDSVFFERFYGGGIGSMRGFRFRGVSPRSGRGDDPVGGDFVYNGSVEVNFPIYENMLRGVVFSDFGDVESDVKFGVVRTSVGAGIRFSLPFLGQTPFAIDFAVPITRGHHDETQFISFSLGFSQ
jgi:outer membrane protein insertion porin family